MSDAPPGKPTKVLYVSGAVVVGLVLAYFGVTWGIRYFVTTRIQKSAGRMVPGFELADLSGRVWTAQDLRGKKTVLNFFRSRCPNCVQESGVIRQLAREADPIRVQVVGVMMDRVVAGISADLTRTTLARLDYRHPILMADATFADAFHGAGWAHVTPVTYVVDANGRITHTLRGHQTLETLRAATR